MLPLSLAFIKLNPTYFAVACNSKATFFFIPAWYEYLPVAPDPNTNTCAVQSFNFPTDLLPVGLAVIDMITRLAGFVAVVSIIIAGVSYITASGNPEKAASARRRIYYSLIGLVIAFVAAGAVAFIGNSLG